ncbi:LysR family transcriptional regulator [Novosphingobium sp.]|uniref:LysR family transcriptional regulator n=1 Tax=Novosphingobium sp. TaxID=1874826 RepID=UPI00352ABE4C
MDNRLGEMETFLAVARQGSLAGAARELRLTPSAVSRALGRLEARLGVQLIARTTRALALTPEGEAYRVRVAGLLEEIDELERDFPATGQSPSGRLRINASVPFGVHCLIPVLPEFQQAFPAITLDLALTDAMVDLVDERADIAIRVGPLRDSGLRARKLGHSTMAVVASPAYLERHGTPRVPADLEHHTWLRFSFRRSVDSWPFRTDGVTAHQVMDGRFLGNSGEVVRMMALAGGGIARLARFHVAADLAAGRLVELLTPFNPGDGEDIHALHVGHDRLATRIRAFLDFLETRIRL